MDVLYVLKFIAIVLCIATTAVILILAKVIEIQNHLKGKGMKL